MRILNKRFCRLNLIDVTGNNNYDCAKFVHIRLMLLMILNLSFFSDDKRKIKKLVVDI